MVERQSSDEHPPDDANGTTDEQGIQEGILALAGCWSDLMWDVVEKGLDRIRNDSQPSSPLTL